MHGIFIPNIESAILTQGKVTGKLKQKCIDVAPRAVHCLQKGDGIVLYAPITDAFRGYIEDLYGFSPTVFAPTGADLSPDTPLSIVDALLAEPRLLEQIAAAGRGRDWIVAPFIPHPSVFRLGRALDLPVGGMIESHVRRGNAGKLNDKVDFQRICRARNIPVPESIMVDGWDALVAAVRDVYRTNHGVMLRQSRTNGGLGTAKVTAEGMRARGIQRLETYVEELLSPRDGWENQPILVEPYLRKRCSPSTLLFVNDGRAKLVSHTVQILEDDVYVGCRNPSDLPGAILDRMIEMTHRYAEHAIALGFEGYVGIDWELLEDGSFVALESNARYGGQNHVLAIAKRLCRDRINCVRLESRDVLKVRRDARLEEMLHAMRKRGVAWDAKRGDGVVISIPPANGSMGFVAVAETEVRLRRLVDEMNALARDSFRPHASAPYAPTPGA